MKLSIKHNKDFLLTHYITTSYVHSVYGNGFDANPQPKKKSCKR